MLRRVKQGLVPLIASLMVIIGLTAGVSASTGLQLPSWGGDGPPELAGPLGLNPTSTIATAPVSISIPDASVDAEVERNQIVDGVMLDPSGPWVVSWYQETGELGEVDNSVMSGHVDYWDFGPAVFWTVADLPEGAEITVQGENGASYTYAVEWIKTYDVAGLTEEAMNEIVGPPDYRALTLITCGGDFDYDRGEYLSRTVIRARLVEPEGVPVVADAADDVATETATGDGTGTAPGSAELAIGGSASITDDGVNLRSEATTGSDVESVLSKGQVVSIVDGPRDADGYTWWNIALADGTEGWIAAEFLVPQ
jgi:hypothetical protein